MTNTMRFKQGTMIYGKNLNIEFIGTTASEPLPDGRIQLVNAAIKRKEWMNILDPIYERKASFVAPVDVALFDLLYDVKKQKGISLKELLKDLRIFPEKK
jgi:hypothetical protein